MEALLEVDGGDDAKAYSVYVFHYTPRENEWMQLFVLLFRAVFHGSIEIEIDPVLEVWWHALNYCPKFLVINSDSPDQQRLHPRGQRERSWTLKERDILHWNIYSLRHTSSIPYTLGFLRSPSKRRGLSRDECTSLHYRIEMEETISLWILICDICLLLVVSALTSWQPAELRWGVC